MIHKFNSPFIFTMKIKNHLDIKKHLTPIISAHYESNKDKQQSKWGKSQTITNHYNQDWSAYRQSDIDDIVWQPVNQMFEELSSTKQLLDGVPKQSKLLSLWWNTYEPNSYAPPHDHRGYDFSAVYFLHLDEPNTLCFQPYSFDSIFPSVSTDVVFTDDITEEGSIVIFPAHLLHYVNPCKKIRRTISFNIQCDLDGSRFD